MSSKMCSNMNIQLVVRSESNLTNRTFSVIRHVLLKLMFTSGFEITMSTNLQCFWRLALGKHRVILACQWFNLFTVFIKISTNRVSSKILNISLIAFLVSKVSLLIVMEVKKPEQVLEAPLLEAAASFVNVSVLSLTNDSFSESWS